MRKIIKILAGLVVLTVLAVIILPFAIPVDTMKGAVLARIEAATGRKVAIGKISLSMFPNIALAADGVRIGNPAWAGAGDMAEVKRLRLGVELMPLLHKQVNVRELTFESPVITLIKNGERANWQLAASESKANEIPGAGKEKSAGQENLVIPGHIAIKNGKLIYKDSASGTHVISGISLSLKAPDPAGKADISFSGDVDGKKADITLEIGRPLTLMKGKPSDIDAKIAYDNIKLAWQGTLALVNNKPDLTGKVTIPSLDAAAFSKPSGKVTPAPAPAPAAAPPSSHWSDARIDMSGLNSADADLTVAIGKLILPKTTLNDIQLALQLAHGVLNVKTNDIAAYDGVLKATISAASAGKIEAAAAVSHVKAGPLLHDFAGMDKLSGTLDADVQVTSQGSSQRALVSALNGDGKFSFRDGKLKGVDIAGMVRNIATGGLSGGEQSTDFSELSGTFTIHNGIASNNDLKMLSPLLRVTGAGTADLPDWQVQYLLQPKLVASIQGQGGKDIAGITVPIRVEGALDNPRYRPDMQAALKSNLANPAQLKDTLKQFKKDLGGNLQNILR